MQNTVTMTYLYKKNEDTPCMCLWQNSKSGAWFVMEYKNMFILARGSVSDALPIYALMRDSKTIDNAIRESIIFWAEMLNNPD